MAHTDSAKKRIKTTEEQRIRNKDKRSAMKSHLKRVDKAIADGNKAAAKEEMQLAMQKIDKAAKHRVIHPNNAARKKSSLAARVNKMA